MSHELDPKVGRWYRRLDDEELFKVVSIDEDDGLIEVKTVDGEIEELDSTEWVELDLEAAEAPEDYVDPEEETDEEDDLFSDAGAVLRQPGGLASLELRRWVDDTGRHSCRGRLIRFLDGKVQLRKENGRTTTVPLHRLSQDDLEFVNRRASAQRATHYGETVQTTASIPLAAN